MSATGNELVKLSQLRGTINGLRTDLQSANLTNTNTSIIQTTGGSLAIKDGQELVKKVEGQSYVWNQTFCNSNVNNTIKGLTFTYNKDTCYFTLSGTATSTYETALVIGLNFIANHKYFLEIPTIDGNVNTGLFYEIYQYPSTSYNWSAFQDGNRIFTASGNMTCNFLIRTANTTTSYNHSGYIMLYDLTAMGLGNITSVAQFKAIFPNTYYPYSAPTLVSANNEYKNIGRQLWDEEWELGYIDGNGTNVASTTRIRSKNYIQVIPNSTIYAKAPYSFDSLILYDDNKQKIQVKYASNTTYTLPSNCHYIRFSFGTNYGTTYNHDICINKSDASFNGTYEPYQSNLLSYNGTLERKVGSYTFTGNEIQWALANADYHLFKINLSVLGLSFVNTTNVICDKYTQTTKILSNAPNLSFFSQSTYYGANNITFRNDSCADLNAFKSAITGTTIVYELATPTTEEIVNATNVELKGVGTAKDTLYNESGLASWKNGLTEQVNKNGIVAIPYSVSEEFAVSINGQLQHNLEVDKSQQEEIQELTSRMYFTETSTNNPAQLYGGNWTQVGTTTIGTTTIYCWKKGE